MKNINVILFITLWMIPAFSSNASDLNKTDWHAQWIGLDRAFPWDVETANSRLSARYFRKEFSAAKDKVISAKVYIIGLGLYELYVNGEKIGEHVLSPTPTDYTKSVKYNVLDVTKNITSGKNALGVILGTGHFYNNRQNTRPEKHKHFGYPRLFFQLEIEYANGSKQTVASDETWRVTSDGPIRSTNTFDGEIYDATKELDGWNKVGYKDKQWLKPDLVSAPEGKISAQLNPNMKIMKILEPKSITHFAADTFILDMGQNMVGWLELKAQGKRGHQIKLRFAETLDKNGRLRTVNLRTAQQTNIYTMKGASLETWEPRFATLGFRYVEITNFPETPTVNHFRGKVVYDDIETIGHFESSNPLLDQIIKNAWWGINGNYKGMPLDCPQRDERQAWMGDHTIGCFGQSFLFDNQQLYIKWLDDIRNAQTEEGTIPDICPPYYMTYYSDNMTWPGAYLMVAQMIYRQFGNQEPIKDHYTTMKKWLMHMKKYMREDFVVTRDKYGDWCVPPESEELIHSNDPARKTDGHLIATAYYYYFLQLMQQYAVIAGHRNDVAEYADLAENMRKGFHRAFFDPLTGHYSNGTITANLLPLTFGMTNPKDEARVFQNIIDRIVSDRFHISTGVIGTSWLLRELTKRGRTDLAYTIATQKTYPGWGYMVENGATTIWELWNGDTANPRMNSHNHVMLLGDFLVWVFEDLAGIKTHRNYNGFKWLWMKPHPTEDLTFVNASYKTPSGLVKSEWQLKDDLFTWKIIVPEGVRANILIPARALDDIQENGRPVMQVQGLKFVRIEENRINLEIGSGDYEFTCPYGEAQNRWKLGVVSEMLINRDAPYPESHAATVAETGDGTIVAAWFGGTKERNPDVCIWFSRLIDGKWTPAQNVANGIVDETTRHACWNPVLYQVPGGALQLYYKVGPNVAGWTGKVITSNDGGLTWSTPRNLPEGFLGPIKNKPVLLKNGTLVSPSSREGEGGWRVLFELSNDFGKTMTKTSEINDGRTLQGIQPVILVHQNGHLQILCRTQQRRMGESWSTDNGKTWSPMTLSNMPNNNSGFDGVTLRDGRHLLVYNHLIPHDLLPRGKGERTPLNIAVSNDGKKWDAAAVLEDSPIPQYSYPSVIQSSDGLLHIVYTWRRKAIKHIVIDPQQLVLSEIENLQWPSSKETEKVQIVNHHRYKVSVCDWMMLKRQKIGGIELVAELGADGLELDLGGLGQNISFENALKDKKARDQFISECNRLGIQFSSLALSAFYGQSFAKRENYEQLMDEAIATMTDMGVKVAFLPMGNQSDVAKEPELYPVILERLKVIAKKAEAAGVVIGVETTLPAKEEAKLIDQINSPAIRSYVNFSAILKRNGNIINELQTLGKSRIIQIHASNTDGFWIENDPALNMKEIKAVLDKMGWSGWLVIERSRDVNDVHNVKRNYGANVRYLKSVFQKE